MRPVRGIASLAMAFVAACSFGGNPVTSDAGPDEVDADPATCPAPFTLSPEGCHASPAATAVPPLAWAAARTACQALGGDLPVIDSATESSLVASAATANKRVWIGLTGTNVDGSTWTWVDTQTVAQRGLSLWVAGQPSAGERCAMIRPIDGKWLGRDCAARLVVVCEKS